MSELAQPKPAAPPLRRPGIVRFSAVELLITLVLLFVISPFIEDLQNGDIIEAALITVVLTSAALAVGASRRTLILATALVLPALLGKWLNHFRPDLLPPHVFLLAGAIFLIFIITHLLRFILRAPRVNSDVLCAGVSVYLMLGLLWVLAYLLVALINPDAFAFTVGPVSHRAMNGFTAFYFSFATMTTIGYGDIIPVSNEARMLAVMQAVTGMFYVAILISRLVALYASNPQPSPASAPPDPH
jgi:hypothetical protein